MRGLRRQFLKRFGFFIIIIIFTLQRAGDIYNRFSCNLLMSKDCNISLFRFIIWSSESLLPNIYILTKYHETGLLVTYLLRFIYYDDDDAKSAIEYCYCIYMGKKSEKF